MEDGLHRHPSSYRDPSGYLFYQGSILYRQVSEVYRADYELFRSSGLFSELIEEGLLVPHEEIHRNLTGDKDWFLTLQPEHIPFISYPYEWCFDMLKDAALLTLTLAKKGLEKGMMLKDATSYNVQWHKGNMRFIDTLSFEKYKEAQPWIAYRQFCEQFLAPLALMHYLKEPLQNILLAYPEGIPLPLTRRLLPGRSRWNLNNYLHLHLHGKAARKKGPAHSKPVVFSRAKMNNLLRSLEEAVSGLHLSQPSGVWSGYYDEAILRDDYVDRKKEIIGGWMQQLQVSSCLDAGANEGTFSLLAASTGRQTIAADFDHYSINNLYKRVKKDGLTNILPLIVDLAHPTPSIGVNNTERTSLTARMDAGVVMALALVHHLAIGKNIPFEAIAKLFRSLGQVLIIEFVPKNDEKILLMLEAKKDVYDWYTKEAFLGSFSKFYKLVTESPVGTSGRTLYLMQPHEQ
jgi:2-polyprenyl-3-methyl-5-hydroxy-6-metoxy-1,4-benzoquinol methylase